MRESHSFQNLLEQVTFWRVAAAFLLVGLIKIIMSYLKIALYLKTFRTKYGAKTIFRFPIGFPQLIEEDPADSFSGTKKDIKENPKCRLIATHVGPKKMILLIDPVLIKAFLTDQTRYKKSSFFGLFNEILGKGLVFSNGKVWKKHRKLISETFRFEFIASQIPTICRVAKDIFEKEFTETKGKHINILDLYQRITGELVFQIFFGSDLINANINGKTPTKCLSRLSQLAFENILSPENVLFGVKGIHAKLFKRNREFFQLTANFQSFIINIIEERKKKMATGAKTNGTKDFLSILLEAQKLNQGTEDEFTDEEVFHEFLTFFIAGMDTTGHLLTMATYYYYNSPQEVKDAVMKEAEFLVKRNEDITPEKLNKVETISAFLKEALRMAGPAPIFFDREAAEEHHLADVKIPKGAMINCSFVSNNFNPEYFKAPEEFNLNRWIPGHEDFDEKATKDPFIYTPFSAGPRNCIGQHLATMEAKIIFSVFLTSFKFKIPEDFKMRMRMLFLYTSRDPFYIDIEKRD